MGKGEDRITESDKVFHNERMEASNVYQLRKALAKAEYLKTLAEARTKRDIGNADTLQGAVIPWVTTHQRYDEEIKDIEFVFSTEKGRVNKRYREKLALISQELRTAEDGLIIARAAAIKQAKDKLRVVYLAAGVPFYE